MVLILPKDLTPLPGNGENKASLPVGERFVYSSFLISGDV